MLSDEVRKKIELLRDLCRTYIYMNECTNDYSYWYHALLCHANAKMIHSNYIKCYNELDDTKVISYE